MRRDETPDGGVATLAVLAAAAREAEELLSVELDLEPAAVAEANRRLTLFMRAARNTVR